MHLEPVCDLEATYAPSTFGVTFVLVRPYGGDGGMAYGELNGTVSGEKLRGALHLANHPDRRGDGVMLPDAHGVIKTDDGKWILIAFQGRTVFKDGLGSQLLTVQFHTEDEPYKWLNDTMCVLEGLISPKTDTMRAKIYSCVSNLK
jgi:hypothetical protein